MRIGILTGGGDCPGLNAVIRAVIRKGISTYHHAILGIRNGYQTRYLITSYHHPDQDCLGRLCLITLRSSLDPILPRRAMPQGYRYP
jgi:Phosphofructokinase